MVKVTFHFLQCIQCSTHDVVYHAVVHDVVCHTVVSKVMQLCTHKCHIPGVKSIHHHYFGCMPNWLDLKKCARTYTCMVYVVDSDPIRELTLSRSKMSLIFYASCLVQVLSYVGQLLANEQEATKACP